jgi:hypothetical protein
VRGTWEYRLQNPQPFTRPGGDVKIPFEGVGKPLKYYPCTSVDEVPLSCRMTTLSSQSKNCNQFEREVDSLTNLMEQAPKNSKIYFPSLNVSESTRPKELINPEVKDEEDHQSNVVLNVCRNTEKKVSFLPEKRQKSIACEKSDMSVSEVKPVGNLDNISCSQNNQNHSMNYHEADECFVNGVKVSHDVRRNGHSKVFSNSNFHWNTYQRTRSNGDKGIQKEREVSEVCRYGDKIVVKYFDANMNRDVFPSVRASKAFTFEE